MKLTVAGLNFNIHWKDKDKNFSEIEQRLSGCDADLFMLPEMFSTGFCMEAEAIADRNGESLLWMKDFARRRNAAVAGSVSVYEDQKFFNRFYFVKPDGSAEFYDKRHLFSFSGEDKIYTPGTERVVAEYKGFRFLLQVCYDLRFPVFSRCTGDYDVALYVANWPKSRVEAWKHLLKARAIENQAYVFGLNRIGTDGNQLEYEESSRCHFADGGEISARQNDIVTAEFDIGKLKEFREKFPFLKDQDGFEILM